MEMQNKPIWKISAILFVLVMLVSCVTPCIAFADHLTDNTYDFFPSENITANNTPFPYHRMPIDGDMPFDPYFDFRHGYVSRDRNLSEVSLQIPFIENEGQIKNESVKYYAKTLGGTVFITKDGQVVYSLPNFEKEKEGKGWVIKESFIGTSISNVKGENESTAKVNYFKGKDSSKWRTNISTYNLVSLGEIYQGIELKLKACGNNVEKLFYVTPNANSERIKVKIEGAEGLTVNEEGELEVETGLGVVKFTKPVAYQEEDGKRKYVDVAYTVKGDEYSFKVEEYDRTKLMVIDPLLASTFIGGSYNDYFEFIAIDSSGIIFVAGWTSSSDYPTTAGAYDTSHNGGYDVFVSKLDSDLSASQPNISPTASFTYSPENPVVNQTITFNASSSYDPDENITSYEWDFGDGNTTNITEPIITYSYASAGTYNINLTVTDDGGATNSTSKTITVSPLTAIFDTGSPANPYPSIMGNHTGTIKPNHTVIATKLYTYPCAGTGGHTEYAEITNATWNATATWKGYASDWHNITFDKTVVLLANENYYYMTFGHLDYSDALK